MTRRSSGIRAAWHFWFAVSFGGEGGLREVGLCGTHPLTQRYNSGVKIEKSYSCIHGYSTSRMCFKSAGS
ncbi:TPA: DUF3265 domain-containing protein [Vibrio parahaemolyticus]|nr:DUF3265 domain-containing protein [Vibrio parahaemolyticus]